MATATKADIKKAASFQRRIHRLQADIYDFQLRLEEKGLSKEAEMAGNSGFELDTCNMEMQKCTRLLQSSNHGPQ